MKRYYQCEKCKRVWTKTKEARECEARLIIVPRYKRGDSLEIKYRNSILTFFGVVVGFGSNEKDYDPHTTEIYVVKIQGRENETILVDVGQIIGIKSKDKAKKLPVKYVSSWREFGEAMAEFVNPRGLTRPAKQ